MSPAMTALSGVGITHSMLILAVLFVAAAVVIGMYWHVILPGAGLIAVALLFISAPSDKQPEVVKQETQIESTPEAKESVAVTEEQQFMEDCLSVAEYPMFKCKQLWNERRVEEKNIVTEPKEVSVKEPEFRPVSDIKLLDVDNQEYKAKRAAALSKPNAVVLQATYR